jgi:hypothetical protein
MKYLHFMLLAIMMVVMTCQCKDGENMIDPCDVEGLVPVNASFSTFDEFGWQDSTRLLEADTFIVGRYVTFIAQQEDAGYQWKVGDDPRVFDEKRFTLFFQGIEGAVDIQLIVESTPNLECFPDDDGRDTINKKIHFVEAEDSPLFGMFRGTVGSAPNDTFDIDIQLLLQGGDTNIDNFPNGCIRNAANRLSFPFGYRHFAMISLNLSNECPKPQGWGFLGTDGVINMNYTIKDSDIQELVSDYFIGEKIN